MCLTLLKKTVLNIANPDLKPETIDTLETGFKLAPLPGLFVDPAAYYTIGRDFIYTTNISATLAQKQNIGRVKIYGAELPVKYYAGNLSFAAAYAWSESEIEDAPGYTSLEGRTLTNSPHETVSATVGLKTEPADLTLGWLYKSKQFTKDDNSEWVRGYHTFSASAARAFSRNISAKLSVENIFNNRHQEGFVIAPPSSTTIPDLAPGRTLTVSMQAKF
jgi:outer membrane receptor protein involved in Fe transport